MKNRNLIAISCLLSIFLIYLVLFFYTLFNFDHEFRYAFKTTENLNFHKKYSTRIHHIREETSLKLLFKKATVQDLLFTKINNIKNKDLIVLFQGDSWMEQLTFSGDGNFISSKLVKDYARDKKNIAFVNGGTGSYSPSLMSLQIDVLENNFNINFRLSPSKNKYITTLRKAIKSASEVILATDDDREGEAISWHICKAFNLPLASTKRIIFNEITKSAIKKAITNPKLVNMDIVNAQLARQVLDLLVGFTISPILWKHISRTTNGSLSAGRCQTPALRLVYEQQKLINEIEFTKMSSSIALKEIKKSYKLPLKFV